MEAVLIVVHYLICFFLIVIILLQAGKGADIGAVFGGASQTVFGGRGPATFLNKATAVVAIGFLVTSIWLAQISKTRSMKSVVDKATSSETAQPVPVEDEKPAEAGTDTKPESSSAYIVIPAKGPVTDVKKAVLKWLSFPRKRESIVQLILAWIPAFAGMTSVRNAGMVELADTHV